MRKQLCKGYKRSLVLLASAVLMSGCKGQQSPAGTAEAVTAPDGAVTDDTDSWKPDLKTITFRVANAAGGNADLATRLIAKAVQDQYGVTAVVQNITGSSGFLMATDLNSYDPSPCELMFGTDTLFAIAPLFNESIQVSLDDYEILYGSDNRQSPSVLAVSSELGIHTWEEFQEYAKSNRILAASNTPGGLTHLQVAALMGEAGIEFTSVTDSGGNKNILSCLNGDANCVMVNTGALAPYVDSGQMVPLVQYNEDPFEWEYGTIPSVADFGYDIAMESCSVMCVRKDADPVGVAAMAKTITDYLGSEKGIAEMKEINTEMVVMDPESARVCLEKFTETVKRLKEAYYKQ